MIRGQKSNLSHLSSFENFVYFHENFCFPNTKKL